MFPCFTFISLAQTISYKDGTQIHNILLHFAQKGKPNTEVRQDASDAWTKTTGHAWYAPAEQLWNISRKLIEENSFGL